ncbi:glycosyltransferase family 4 protein [Oculatella sp. FACHB-28]|uniref:glycosyltransferase family 4 protein n=2 Tax=Cyanophyceae TaxID=3028117 RepID=UPI001682612B|nr:MULTISPECIES: glycosyltransferase family 4 protein [Cyanophyceae]MBD1866780.1 glycosyltransferase family 4 protein [Cyanobacteria bacterium FACHB-471]MBD2056617.1 glycosyltransferase family 4 protein [Oculatella sp. FACHB-28]MBD2070600.1 glycosyltransferase family 4 protein [Leptolyngbya sp. FACHB-671]
MVKPNILVVCRSFLPQAGGIEEYAYNRCLQDPERVVVATMACDGDQAFDRLQPFPIHRWLVPKWVQSPRGLGSVRLTNFCRQVVRMTYSCWFAVKLFRRYRYDYIEWCHGYEFSVLLFLSYLLPIQFFVYLHGDDVLEIAQKPLSKLLFNLLLKRAKGVVCNSSFTQAFLKSNFHCDASIHVIHPTVRPEKFGCINADQLHALRCQMRKNCNIPETAVVILSVGRLVRRKGFDRIIKNLPNLIANQLDVHYLICGQGWMEEELKALATELNVQDRVHFLGYVTDQQLAGYYAACDFFSMLTFFDEQAHSIEGFGIVYLEAAYFGKPVLASKAGGVEDAVIHGVTGLLVDPNSTAEISKTLSQLCQDQRLREQLGQSAKAQPAAKNLHRLLYATDTVSTGS